MGLHDAVSSIIDRTIAWIEHDRLQESNGPVTQPQLSQDMLKQSPHSPPYINLPTAPNIAPSHNDTKTMNGPTSHVISTPRNNYYSEATPESGAYSISYANPAPHTTNTIPFDPNNSFLYAQTAGQVEVSHAHTQAQAQAQVQAQVQMTEHNPIATFATQATQMTQPEIMWRQQPSVGNTWQDWTAAIVDNQDRYSASALMSLGGSGPRPNAHVDGNATSGLALGVGMDNTPTTTTATATNTGSMQWPLLLFSDGTGVLET